MNQVSPIPSVNNASIELNSNSKKRQMPRNPITEYGIYYWTKYDGNRKSTTGDTFCYQLRPIGIGRISNLRDKLSLLTDLTVNLPNKQQNESAKLHPMLQYLLEKQIRYDYIKELKLTRYQSAVQREWQVPQKVLSDVLFFIKQIISSLNAEKQTDKNMNRPEKERSEKLKEFNLKMEELMVKYKTELRKMIEKGEVNIPGDKGANLEDKYKMADLIWDQVRSLQPLNLSSQFLKYKLFAARHKDYFCTNRLTNSDQKIQKVYEYEINIKKYSQEPESILHTIQDHIYFRKNSPDNYKLSASLIKGIFQQLIIYHKKVSNQQGKCYYHWLNPKNVVFNQMTLKMQLKFQPVVQDSLGLRRKPLNIQNKLAFAPTPQGFDYFRSQIQLEPQTQLILDDPFFGCIEMYGDDIKNDQILKKVKQEKIVLDNILQKVMIGRYLLTSYYLLHGQVLGQQKKPLSSSEKQQQFKKLLKRQEQNIIKDPKLLVEYLGYDGSVDSCSNFELDFNGLIKYLGLAKQDSFVEDKKYQKIKMFRCLRNLMLREMIKIYVTDNVFHRIFNVKKYICIFALIVFEIIEETVCLLQKKDERVNIRKILQIQIRRLSNSKTYYQYLEITFRRIMDYVARNPNNDYQSKYLNCDPEGKATLSLLKELKKYTDAVIQLNSKLTRLENKIGMQQNDYINTEHYEQCLQEMQKKLAQQSTIKQKCYQMIQKQMKSTGNEDNFHKLPNNQEMTRKSYHLLTKRLELIINTYFSISPQNIYNYETLVIPLLKLDDTDRRIQVRIVEQESFQEEISCIRAAEQIIRMTFPQSQTSFASNLRELDSSSSASARSRRAHPSGYSRQSQSVLLQQPPSRRCSPYDVQVGERLLPTSNELTQKELFFSSDEPSDEQ